MGLYTLRDLLDQSIGTPEKGAVNFNVLHLILKTILEKTGIGDTLVEWNEPELLSSLKKLFTKGDMDEAEGLFDELEAHMKELEEAARDRGTNTDPLPELQQFSTRIDLLESNSAKLIDMIASFQKEIDGMKRPRYGDEDYKREGPLNQEEIDNILEDINEAVGTLGIKLKKHIELSTENFQTLEVQCLRATEEYLEESRSTFNRKLQDIAIATRALQKLFKEVIYPVAAGVTKCFTCGRKARLPHLDVLGPSDGGDHECDCPKSPPSAGLDTPSDTPQRGKHPEHPLQDSQHAPAQDTQQARFDFLREVKGMAAEPTYYLEAIKTSFRPTRLVMKPK